MAPTPPPVKDDKLSAIMARRRQMADAPASPDGSVVSATTSVKSKPKDEDNGGSGGGGGSGHIRSDFYEAMMKRRTLAQNGTVHQSPRQKINAEKFKHVKLDSSLQDKLKQRMSLEERSISRRSQVSNESGTQADDEGGQRSSGNLSTESFGSSSPPSYASVAVEERSTFSNKSASKSHASSQRETSRSGRSISERSNENGSDRNRHGQRFESYGDQATDNDDAADTSDDNDTAPFPEHDNSNSVDNDPFGSSGEDDDDPHHHTDDENANAYTSDDNVYPTRGTAKPYSSESEYEEVTIVSSRNSSSQRGDSSFFKQASFETLGTLGGGGGGATADDDDDPFDRPESVPRDNSFFGTHSVTSRDEELTRITEEHDEMQQHVDEEQATLESYEEQTVSDHPTSRGHPSAHGERGLYDDDVTVEEEARSGTGSTRHSRNVEEQESSYETDDAADDEYDPRHQTPYSDDNDYDDDGYNDHNDAQHAENDHETDDEHNNYASDDQYDHAYYDHVDSSGQQEPLYELDTTGFSQGAPSTDGWSVDHNEGVEVTEESSRVRTRSFGGSCDGDRSILSGLSVLEAVLEEDSEQAGEDSKGAAYDGVFGGKIVDGKIDRDIPMGSEDSVLNETMALTSDDANNESRDHSEQALSGDPKKKRNSFWCSWPFIVCTVLFTSVGAGVGLGMLFWQQSDSNESSESGERQPGNIFATGATPTGASTMAPSRLPITPDLSPDVSSVYTLLCSKLADCNGLLDILTPRGMAFDWLVNNKEANPDLTAQSEYTKVQRYALATLYYSTGGDTWSNKTNWLSNLDACQWWSGSGSGCGVFNNNFTILDLDDNNVQGVLPTDLALLTSLTAISIQNPASSTPDIGGSLPSSLGLLTSLTALVLTGNLFSGNIPTELSSCTMLEILDLSNNNLNGGIPTSFASLSKLSVLNLEGNFFAGEPDSTIFEGTTGLVDLNLQGNRLTSIPTSIIRLTQLRNLNLGSNLLSTFPLAVTELEGLSHLNLKGNMFADQVPVQIGRLTSLRYLDLSGNSFSGNIPVEIGRLTSLSETLDLSDNGLTGSISTVLGQLIELKQLKLNGNDLAGQVPSELALLSKLEELRIEDNAITGTVPMEVCTLLNAERAAASYADCDELALPPCFTFCCTNGEDCVCRFEMEDPFRCVKRESS
jgi:Leucine-rich repeat (LRR) protein